ncbi:MAG: hypothetical protein ACLS43_05100 [Evtepia gabavorous]
MSIIVGILLFGLLIAVHEGGHFSPPSSWGQVNEFAIGMGPALVLPAGRPVFPPGLPIGATAMEGRMRRTTARSFSNKSPGEAHHSRGVGDELHCRLVLVAILFAPWKWCRGQDFMDLIPRRGRGTPGGDQLSR